MSSISNITGVKRPRGRPKKNTTNLNIIKDIDISNNKLKSFENNENKNIINNIFVSEIAKSLIFQKATNSVGKFYCGILDSVEHNTSNALVNCGFVKENIIMPEIDINTHRIHKESGFVNAFNGSLETYSSNINLLQNFIGWYFDTCGFIHKQKKGIFDTIKKTNFCDETILGFTFCRSRITTETFKCYKLSQFGTNCAKFIAI